jgi:hypothetical protein
LHDLHNNYPTRKSRFLAGTSSTLKFCFNQLYLDKWYLDKWYLLKLSLLQWYLHQLWNKGVGMLKLSKNQRY